MTSLLTDRSLKSWLSGAVLKTWSWTSLKTVEMIVEETPLLSPIHHHEQHCDCSEVIQVPGHHYLPGLEVGQSHRLHCDKGPAEAVLLLPAEEVQPATWAAEKVYSAIIESVLCTSINVLVQLSYQIWSQKTTEGTNLPTLQELYSSRVSKRAGKITLDPSLPAHSLFELLPSGRRYRALSTRTTRHRNSFFPQAIHLMNT